MQPFTVMRATALRKQVNPINKSTMQWVLNVAGGFRTSYSFFGCLFIFNSSALIFFSTCLLCLICWERRRNIYPFCVFLPVEFDDCAGNKDVEFEVSNPSFHVNRDLYVVPHRDVSYSGPIMFIHGHSAHADDMAQVDITGPPPRSLKVSWDCCVQACVCVYVCFYSTFLSFTFDTFPSWNG